MLIYTYIYGTVFKSSERYFSIFIFIGLSMWDFFNRTVTHSVKLVKQNKGIISKVYLPKFVLIWSEIYINGFKMLVSFLVVAIMMIFFQVPITEYVLYVPVVLFSLVATTFAVSIFLMHFGVYIDDLTNVVSIVLRLLMYFTGIFYSVEKRIPAPLNQLLIKYNPLAFYANEMRNIMIYGLAPHRKLLLAWFLGSLIIGYIGIKFIYRNENSYVKVG